MSAREEKLNAEEEMVFRSGHCPDCGGALLLGPTGGLSVNYRCAGGVPGGGESCFNDMGMFGVERLGVTTCAKTRKPAASQKSWFVRLMHWLTNKHAERITRRLADAIKQARAKGAAR